MGSLCFPKQVREELRGQRHTDMPEAWALELGSSVQFAYDPEDRHVQRVMEVAGELVDADAERDRGDPYVVAQALELQDLGHRVCIVTEDVIDRLPIKISIRTACTRFDLDNCLLADFLAEIGFG